MGHFVSDSVGVKCVGVEKQQLLRFLYGIGFSGMEQHFHAGDVVLGILFLTAFAAVGFLRLTVKKAWSKKLFHSFSCTFSWIFLALVWVMTCNCFLLYHSSAFEDRYMEQVRSENYSKAELAVLRDYIVVNANELAEQMERSRSAQIMDACRAIIRSRRRFIFRSCSVRPI